MTKFQVTLADLRKNGACVIGYNKVVRMLQEEEFSPEDQWRETYIRVKNESPILLADIARNQGLDGALWALRCIPGVDGDSRLFAVWCARQVEHLMADERSKEALNIAERHANGHATSEDLAAAWDAAWDAAWAKSSAAAWAACSAAVSVASRAASRASYRAASGGADLASQLEMMIAMCEGRAPWQM